jgi:Flp pilus assembly pilin Flp
MKTVSHRDEIGVHREKGASLVEYALLCCLIAIVAVAAIKLLGTSISNQFSSLSGEFG